MKDTYRYVPKELPVRRSVLAEVHRRLGARTTTFAGWEMPVHYPAGIMAEHRAVRTAAGLFDISHMGLLEFGGPNASRFLDLLLTNRVAPLPPGRAEYSFMLYPDGTAADDLYLYRTGAERFLLVVNAGNAERVKDWVEAVNSCRCVIDADDPEREADVFGPWRDLRGSAADSLVALALQGPASRELLLRLADTDSDREPLQNLPHNRVVRVSLVGVSTIVSTTGYTGEPTAFELFLHPDQAPKLFEAILVAGQRDGVLPCGLGARDSLRVEAGLPLFGHELEGELEIAPAEAGYEFATKLDKEFFIGKERYLDRIARSRRHLVRLTGHGRKSLRPGHVILDDQERPVGQVTSFAYSHQDLTYFVLACVDERFAPRPGESVLGARIGAERLLSPPDSRALVELTAQSRFPGRFERASWLSRYAS